MVVKELCLAKQKNWKADSSQTLRQMYSHILAHRNLCLSSKASAKGREKLLGLGWVLNKHFAWPEKKRGGEFQGICNFTIHTEHKSDAARCVSKSLNEYQLNAYLALLVKEDKVGRDRNHKEGNPGEMLQGRSAPGSQRDGEEDEEESVVVGRAVCCNKGKTRARQRRTC